MTLDIAQECIKLTKIVGDDTFDYNFIKNNVQFGDTRINFLWQVLASTIKYPQVELYLKDLINCFTVDEIKNIYSGWSILHYMSQRTHSISLGTFKIIIIFFVDVNIMNCLHSTPCHILLENTCNKHINSIMNLFIKNGINLNVKNAYKMTILDTMTSWQKNLNEETKNCIMVLVDFGARTNISRRNNEMYDFIEYCRNSTIKPAIKK